MSHIHDLVDFAVSAFIIHKDKVLLIHHKKLDKWLPIGGHIELDEDPEEALLREVKEESGLTVEIEGEKPNVVSPDTKFLHRPRFVDISNISQTHRHVHFIYFVNSKDNKVSLSISEHYDIKWFSLKDLKDSKYNLLTSTLYYARKALDELS